MTRLFLRRHARRFPLLAACILATNLIPTTIAVPASDAKKAGAGHVNVYSYRQPFLINPLLEAFTAQTGIAVNVVHASRGLGERIAQEGENSPADVLLTVDIGRLQGAKDLGITQAVASTALTQAIKPTYRDLDGHWFGLTLRGRVIYASKERVAEKALSYADLADPRWRGRICIRSGQHVYNIALIASIIANEGEEAARAWLSGFKANLARKPNGNDRAQVKGVYSGECDIAIGNTYYMGMMLTNEKDPEQKEWANAVRLIFPNTENRGTHVNISGVALARYAPNRKNAVALMEYLASREAQRIYAQVNFEYPVREGVPASDLVASWGDLKPDTLSLSTVAHHRKRASQLVDEVAFDEGPGS